MTVEQIGFGDKVRGFLKKLTDGINNVIIQARDTKYSIIPFAVVSPEWNGDGELHYMALRPCAYYAGTQVPSALHMHPFVNFVYVEHDPHEIQTLLEGFKETFKKEFEDGSFNYELEIEKVPENNHFIVQIKYFDIEFGNSMYWAR